MTWVWNEPKLLGKKVVQSVDPICPSQSESTTCQTLGAQLWNGAHQYQTDSGFNISAGSAYMKATQLERFQT